MSSSAILRPTKGIPENRSRPIFAPAAYKRLGREKPAIEGRAPLLAAGRSLDRFVLAPTLPGSSSSSSLIIVMGVLMARLGVQRSFGERGLSPTNVCAFAHFLNFVSFLPVRKKFLTIFPKALHQCTPETFFLMFSMLLVGCSAGCTGVQRGATVVQRAGVFERCTPCFIKRLSIFFSDWCKGATVLMSSNISRG
jgi:hypothetical protein